MGVSTRVPDMWAKWRRDQAQRQDIADATATVELFNRRTAAGKTAVAWPTIGAAIMSKRHWVNVHCETCGLVSDMDIRMKRRPPAALVTVILAEARCPRCNGHGKPRIIALSKFPGG